MLHVAQPAHWLGPVTGPAWLGLAQSKKNKIKKLYMRKNKFILFVYSLTPE
jgi:hypothetical protein